MSYYIKINEDDLSEVTMERSATITLKEGNLGCPSESIHDQIGDVNYILKNFQGFSITQWSGVFKEDIKISGFNESPLFATHFMLQGCSEYTLEGHTSDIDSNSHNLWSLGPQSNSSTFFNKDQYMESFSIVFHPEYLKLLVNRYPELLEKCYTRYCKGETFTYQKRHCNISLEIQHLIKQIKQSHLMGNVQNLYIESKIMEILSIQLQSDNHPHRSIHRKGDIDKIHEAKDILLSNLNNPPTIKELASTVGTNEKKLKYGFKEVFENTIFGYLFDYKMELALTYLKDRDRSIVEIANLCGYEYASHFSTAFKRRFGVAPMQYRKSFS
ncbi:AraC family transcriptional regulator [Halosquirtibacter laminarini]|uniref:AraC family transcriptional regulator n=1 Tax=Halosquirtibacter laminarini TaxID=3374600 RepID=A0AC61NI15_9BACT|nr:AraC family transcriptional regulator [Prolixibacteraceae bacterium]